MKIEIKDTEFIERSVRAKDVFSGDTIADVYISIRNDFYNDVVEGWSDVAPELLGYDWRTTIGDFRLEKQAIEYAIYASELNLYEFLQEFSDYVDPKYHEYEEFIEELIRGKHDIVVSKDLT